MSQKLALNSKVILRAEPQYYDTYAAFHYEKARTEFVTKEEFTVLAYLYDKSAEVREICREAGMKEARCKRFLHRMVQLGFVEVGVEGLTAQPPERRKNDVKRYRGFPIPFLSAPTTVDVFITSRCNLKCVHCFSGGEENGKDELSATALASLFTELETMGVFEVRINGGEPFLHAEIGTILMDLKKRRLRTVILTNGTLLNAENVRLLKESRVIPTVSLDDSVAAEHDRFRGVEGAFERTVEGLKRLKQADVMYGINCCLHRRNLNRPRDIIDLAVRYGAAKIAFLDLKGVGRMKNHGEWVPSYEAYQQCVKLLMAAKARYRDKIDVSLDVFLHCYPLSEAIREGKRGYVSCHAGRNRLAIDSRGAVYPCNLVLSDPRWCMGELGKDTLSEIWFSKKWVFFRGGVTIRDLHQCRSCKDVTQCKDVYCRLLPYVTCGDAFAPHPRCG